MDSGVTLFFLAFSFEFRGYTCCMKYPIDGKSLALFPFWFADPQKCENGKMNLCLTIQEGCSTWTAARYACFSNGATVLEQFLEQTLLSVCD